MISSDKIIIRDSTLREGLDVPGVSFSLPQRLELAQRLAAIGIDELEVLAPGRVDQDIRVAREIKQLGLAARTTGLLYARSPRLQELATTTSDCLDHVDMLVPASPKRQPYDFTEKIRLVKDSITVAKTHFDSFGVGFPNATQIESELLQDLVGTALACGVHRITLYDTNGSADPFRVSEFVSQVRKQTDLPLFFHGHNDLGMATANTLAAIHAGVQGVDVTTNGLGDRAGNCALEQIVVALELAGIATQISLSQLPSLCRFVSVQSGIEIPPLAPISGGLVFSHKSPGHFEVPELFEAFDPGLVGRVRELIDRD